MPFLPAVGCGSDPSYYRCAVGFPPRRSSRSRRRCRVSASSTCTFPFASSPRPVVRSVQMAMRSSWPSMSIDTFSIRFEPSGWSVATRVLSGLNHHYVSNCHAKRCRFVARFPGDHRSSALRKNSETSAGLNSCEFSYVPEEVATHRRSVVVPFGDLHRNPKRQRGPNADFAIPLFLGRTTSLWRGSPRI